jgi:hypothetical protein
MEGFDGGGEDSWRVKKKKKYFIEFVVKIYKFHKVDNIMKNINFRCTTNYKAFGIYIEIGIFLIL